VSDVFSPARYSSYTPIPDALLGEFLEDSMDARELPCLLRTLYVIHHALDSPKAATGSMLQRDPVMRQILVQQYSQSLLKKLLERAVLAGFLLCAIPPSGESICYLLNNNTSRGQMFEKGWKLLSCEGTATEDLGESEADWPNIFALYERHVGMITARIAEELRDADVRYPESLVKRAFEEAIIREKRSWPYIAAILERWVQEGKS
jgi:DnaD/phage-associated family protein